MSPKLAMTLFSVASLVRAATAVVATFWVSLVIRLSLRPSMPPLALTWLKAALMPSISPVTMAAAGPVMPAARPMLQGALLDPELPPEDPELELEPELEQAAVSKTSDDA